MANQRHLEILSRGLQVWNQWHASNPNEVPDLGGVDLAAMNLKGAVLFDVNLSGAHLERALLCEADLYLANLTAACLRGADLRGADLGRSFLREADFREADLSGSSLQRADLFKTNFSRANLCGADLTASILVETDLTDADLSGCSVYGISAWGIHGTPAKQTDLVITRADEPPLTVDNLEVAQFIYLLLSNERIRDVIDTITSKVVLILGRFTPERKAVLDALRNALRVRGYSPVVFDFEKTASQTLTETVRTLASLARFVLADITDAKSVLQELMAIVPDFPSLAVQPLLLAVQEEPGMFGYFKKYPWVLPTFRYDTQEHLLGSLEAEVVAPAEAKVRELRPEVAGTSGRDA